MTSLFFQVIWKWFGYRNLDKQQSETSCRHCWETTNFFHHLKWVILLFYVTSIQNAKVCAPKLLALASELTDTHKPLVLMLGQTAEAVAPVCVFSHYRMRTQKKQGRSNGRFIFYGKRHDANENSGKLFQMVNQNLNLESDIKSQDGSIFKNSAALVLKKKMEEQFYTSLKLNTKGVRRYRYT